MNTKQVRRQLQDVRRELDEAAESIDRLERALADIEDNAIPPLVGLAEISAITGLKQTTLNQRRRRGSMPEPVVSLAGGRIWRLVDIEKWWQAQ